MKAVIMAGGNGKRLRPLTCTLPKPMARVCDKPVLEYILELLAANGVEEAVLTLSYMPQEILRFIENRRFGTMKVRAVVEEKMLGTAGSVKNAARDFREDFLVISGDAMCDFALRNIYKYHTARARRRPWCAVRWRTRVNTAWWRQRKREILRGFLKNRAGGRLPPPRQIREFMC